jgi:hypothetical protein
MPPNMIGLLIPAVAFIVITLLMFGLPALAVVIVKYFKMKERELALEMEYRQKSQQRDVAIEHRVQCLEDALASLDHDVRAHLGIGQSTTPLQSHRDLLEGPAAPDARHGKSQDPTWTKSR